MTTSVRSGATNTLKALGAVAAGAVLWGSLVERNLFTIRRESLPVVPAGTAPIRVLQLSDLHLAPWQRRKIDWIRSLAELRPDLVVLTGDLMGHVDARDAVREALEPFAATGTPGLFVHGSNDYYGPILKNPLRYLRKPTRRSTRIPDIDTPRFERMLEDDLGFVNLNDTATTLTVRDHPVLAFGLNDPHIHYDNPAEMRSALRAVEADASPEHVRLGVVHAPYQASLDDLVAERADVILAGHTHGGQVRVPGVGALTSNSDLSPRQARGLSVWFNEEHAAFLNVSAGLGTSVYAPIRFCCRPEVSLITLAPSGSGLPE